jgi:hypothetical protein
MWAGSRDDVVRPCAVRRWSRSDEGHVALRFSRSSAMITEGRITLATYKSSLKQRHSEVVIT